MTVITDAITKNNEAYASSFDKGSLALPPAKKYLAIVCMDARIDPAAALGIELGDAHGKLDTAFRLWNFRADFSKIQSSETQEAMQKTLSAQS